MVTFDVLDRRGFLGLAAATGAALGFPLPAGAQTGELPRRPIPVSGEPIPVVGLGTSDEFEGDPSENVDELRQVLRTLVEHGGTLVDTAPGYGDSERLLGQMLTDMGLLETVFLSSKIRQTGAENGRRSMTRSFELLRKQPLDLMMVHSLEDVHTQLANLRESKDAGRVRYIGITTYRAMGYDLVESLIEAGGLDFIQVDYSVTQPLAEQRVIPAAAEHGVAVMINSAFGNGDYFRRLGGRELPAWAAEFDCESWAQFSLKYILGNPDVTCVLAATSNPAHMRDNARAGLGALPDAATRRRMAEHLRDL